MSTTTSPTRGDFAVARSLRPHSDRPLRRWASRRLARMRRSRLYRLAVRLLRIVRRRLLVVLVVAVIGGATWASTTQYAEQRTRSSSASAAPETSSAGGTPPGQETTLTRTGSAELERQTLSASGSRAIPSVKPTESPSALSGLPGRAVTGLLTVLQLLGKTALVGWPLVLVAALGLVVVRLRRAHQRRADEGVSEAVDERTWWDTALPDTSATTTEQSSCTPDHLRLVVDEPVAGPAASPAVDAALPSTPDPQDADEPVAGERYTFDRPEAADAGRYEAGPKVTQRTRIFGAGGIVADDPACVGPRRISILGSAIWSRGATATDSTPRMPAPESTSQAASPASLGGVDVRVPGGTAAAPGAPGAETPLRRPPAGPRTFRTGRSVPAPEAAALPVHLVAELERLRERNRFLEQQVEELHEPARHDGPAQAPGPVARRWIARLARSRTAA